MGIRRLERLEMQKGSIKISGKWWYLKIRQDVTEKGVLIKNKETYHKLLPLAQYPKIGSETPAPVQLAADEIALKVHLKKKDVHAQPVSIDSFKFFLEAYINSLANGELGNEGKKLRKSSLNSYRRDYKVIEHLIPDMPLRSVRACHIQALFNQLVAEDSDDMRATSAYRNIRNFLSGAFRKATIKGLVDLNPVRDITPVQGNGLDTHAYTLAEVKQLMRVIKLEDPSSGDDWKHTMRAAFMVALFTGLRKEEIKGLKWEDYDRKNQVLHIRRTVVNHDVVEDTKTVASKAPVPVVKTVAKELKEHLRRNSGDGFIFHSATKTQRPIIFEHVVREKVHPACKAAGIEFYGMHALRRGLNTIMEDMGIEFGLRVRIMRHSPRNVTDKHYGRASVTQMRKALEKVEAAYKKAK